MGGVRNRLIHKKCLFSGWHLCWLFGSKRSKIPEIYGFTSTQYSFIKCNHKVQRSSDLKSLHEWQSERNDDKENHWGFSLAHAPLLFLCSRRSQIASWRWRRLPCENSSTPLWPAKTWTHLGRRPSIRSSANWTAKFLRSSSPPTVFKSFYMSNLLLLLLPAHPPEFSFVLSISIG